MKILKALVIIPNAKTREFGALIAVARAEARKRERTRDNPPVRSLFFVSELGVYVALYEADDRTIDKSNAAAEEKEN